MRTTRRVLILLASGAHAYHQSEFVELWEKVPQTCINVRAGDTTRDSTAKEICPCPSRAPAMPATRPETLVRMTNFDFASCVE